MSRFPAQLQAVSVEVIKMMQMIVEKGVVDGAGSLAMVEEGEEEHKG